MLPLLADQQARARASLPAEVVDYYAGGAGDGVSLAEAERAWAAVRLLPRVLRDVSAVDTSLSLLGTDLRTPVLVGPTAAHDLAHPDAERATAAGAQAAGSLLVLSARASISPAELDGSPFWHQSYVLRDRDLTRSAAEGATAAGARAVVLTGDVPFLGPRAATPRTALTGRPAQAGDRADPSATLEVVAELAGRTGLPVLVKGVLHPDDALACLAAGADGVIVSNHGGRQLDRAVATAAALPAVVRAVRAAGAQQPGSLPAGSRRDGSAQAGFGGAGLVLVDGGLRSGLDVLCALALGPTRSCSAVRCSGRWRPAAATGSAAACRP